MPKVGMQPIRCNQLIQATLESIDQVGLAESSIAHIARAAKLSTGIISHYFGDKDGLLEASMRELLRNLRDSVSRARLAAQPDARSQLRAIIDGNFVPTQVSRSAMRAWLTFWAASMHQPRLGRLQRANDRRLQSNLCCQFQRALPLAQAREAARGLAAMIDGLWLRGGLMGADFAGEQARAVAYDYVDLLLARSQSEGGPALGPPSLRQ
ncbi:MULTISPECIES: transcriptional regulator BetI [Achromobacter]|uniref:HTH-type transcriptional regulator BetI n=2 Tax=Achromobacter piechaudii TaxID=72556 RepID=A0ABM8KWU4_9BURK|nr:MULTISPECIES: transcriptional regulator BetI [Achromobacter]EFF73195.1 transcriptional repressor BetI [Achromobacter piechaudii ATCC 43553]MPS81452.1 transcriptional regulator BetI [Achromobacter sp.]CAB3678738.1 HTH-type transcriptional regulator BetI [Achromobacter piechaudii]CAB3843641.1 HTH-type transcriptional regulator BetI [Achromobacter piechaudii]CAB3941456.1 HTH-type transcriptional regulator BetI [Achromobacter piechaudii]